MNNSNENFTKYLRPFIYALILFVGVQIGVFVTKKKNRNVVSSGYSKVDEILNYINFQYVDSVNLESKEEEAIQRILSSLDPHSVYIPKSDFNSANEELQGNFEGVGIEFHLLHDTILVVTPISGGPSDMVGIQAGDKIIKINDTLVAGKKITNKDVLLKLRGVGGSIVKVDILRNGNPHLLTFKIKRDKIPIYSVDAAYMIDNEVGYIKIGNFSATTYDEFKEKTAMLKAAGMQRLVIDLRQNPGGYLEAVVRMCDEFLDGDKMVVYTKGNHYPKEEYRAGEKGILENVKLAVLIDEGSASASEILSGAVQDWDRGIVVGRRSFGKGLVQSQYKLHDGSAIRLSIARYYTPSGRCIQKPYTHNPLEYEIEILNRFQHGEQFSKDSAAVNDTTTYFTSQKRKVKGGGGIYPDIFVPLDSFKYVETFSKVRAAIPEYTYSLPVDALLQNYKTPNDFEKSFTVSPELFSNLISYTEETTNQKLAAQEINYLAPRLKNILKAYLARKRWKSDGFYRVINNTDNTYNKALEALKK